MSNDLDELPVGWALCQLSDVVDVHDDERVPVNSSERSARIKGKSENQLYPYYGATGQVGLIDDFLSDKESILLGEDGAPFLDSSKDKAFLVKGKFWVNNHAHILRGIHGLVDNKFICFQLNIIDYRKHVSGTTRLKLTKGALEKLPMRLCSYSHQLKVSEKIEALLTKLDQGVAELKAAQEKLTQYRQTLLKSAVEGTLTKEWREANALKITETGEQLLARILKERRARWEKQKFDEFASKGQTPPKDWQKKYPEPVVPDTNGLPKLPDGWVWASLDMLGEIISGVTKGIRRINSVEVFDVPYLRVANVQRGFLDLSEIKTIPATSTDIEKYTLVKGDVLFNEGGDRDKLGRGWVWYGEIENCIHQNHVFRLRPFVHELEPELISHYGNTFGQQWFQNVGKQTTNLASINKGILQSFPVPLSSYSEQLYIKSLLGTEINSVDSQIQAVELGLKESDIQRKNILNDAFSGKLVEQNPGDEPASVLLDKIKIEREARDKLPKPKNPKKIKEKSKSMKTLSEVLKANGDWMDAQEAFAACGVGDGTDTDRIEKLYADLRALDKAGKLLTERRGHYDMIKLKGI